MTLGSSYSLFHKCVFCVLVLTPCYFSYCLFFYFYPIFRFLLRDENFSTTNFGRNKKRVARHTILACKKGEIKNQETKSNRFKHCCTNEHCIHLFYT